MSTYLVCPERREKRVDMKVCLTRCDTRERCKEFQAQEKPSVPEVVEGEIVGEKELYERALSLRGTIETGFLQLAATLRIMFANRFYYGHSSWQAFIESDPLFDALKIGVRTDGYLRAVHLKYIEELKLDPQECASVGYTKLSLMLPLITKDNAKEWLKKAKGLKTEELSVKVRQETGRLSKDAPQENTEMVSFRLFPEQKETVVRAFEIAKTLCDSDSRSNCFEMICVSFLTEHDHPGMPTERVVVAKNLLKRMETFYGVKVTEMVDNNGEIISL